MSGYLYAEEDHFIPIELLKAGPNQSSSDDLVKACTNSPEEGCKSSDKIGINTANLLKIKDKDKWNFLVVHWWNFGGTYRRKKGAKDISLTP